LKSTESRDPLRNITPAGVPIADQTTQLQSKPTKKKKKKVAAGDEARQKGDGPSFNSNYSSAMSIR